MEVILLKDQRHLGTRGDVINVKPGFARNFLLPQGVALEATPGNIRYFEQQRAKIDAMHAREHEEAAALAAQLAEVQLQVAKRVGETETLYGSVTTLEIASMLADQGFKVDRRRIEVEGGVIKTLGEHTAKIDLHTEVVAEVTVTVVPAE
ncbi:MAG: 50S ribosomal protein L9 [Acidobacteriota bacterium]